MLYYFLKDCQLKALNLSEKEKKINIPTEQDLRQQFNTDYIWNSFIMYVYSVTEFFESLKKLKLIAI
jgi:hypothetical protein